jgi:hypothetical protein
MELFDALTRLTCLVLTIRGLCVLNRMSWQVHSWFSWAVVLTVMSAGYIVFTGTDQHAAEIVVLCMTAMILLDRRFGAIRKD